MKTTNGEAVRLIDVRKVYGTAGNPVTALDGVTLSLPSGSFTAVMGPSGSGRAPSCTVRPASINLRVVASISRVSSSQAVVKPR